MSAAASRPTAGFTMIELIIVVAIVAILATLAVPAFQGLLARKRVEGVVSELVADLNYARSEAVQRNAPVTVTFGTNCYVVHMAAATAASCTQASKTITPTAAELKTVQLQTASATLAAQGGLTSLTFDAVRGWPTFAGVGAAATVSLLGASSVVSDQLRVSLTSLGRVSVCAASGFSGYLAC